MRNRIIVYCQDAEEIKKACEYIKKLNAFKESRIFLDHAEFFNCTKNKQRDTIVRCVTFKESARGIRGNIGLLTKTCQEYLENNEDIMKNIIYCSIGDYFRYTENRQISRSLIAPLSILEKIIRNDITYLLINDHRDNHDIKYMTTDIVSALGYLKDNQQCTVYICKQDDFLCERVTLKIDEEWDYKTIVEIISGLEIKKII